MGTKKPGLMDRMSGAHPDQINGWVEEARTAWESGSAAYVYKAGMLATFSGAALNELLNGVLAIGWTLHSTALAYNQTATNTEQLVWVFLRPTPPRPDSATPAPS